jgi:predicted RNA-binding Zn-ribbon protein involved in translation (DUF1610 family)
MPSNDPTEMSRSDGPVAAYVHVLCKGCDTYLDGEQNGRRHCPRCDLTVAVGCEVERIDIEHEQQMRETANTSTEAPITIDLTVLCHDCNKVMDDDQAVIWTCPHCGTKATAQCQAEVIDDGA